MPAGDKAGDASVGSRAGSAEETPHEVPEQELGSDEAGTEQVASEQDGAGQDEDASAADPARGASGEDAADDGGAGNRDDPGADYAGSWVRPYVWTGGRTSTAVEFALETLVSVPGDTTGTDPDAVSEEHRQVLELCAQPRSVTEIAALLAVPLGVAKTLVGSMAEKGMLVVHRTDESSGSRPNLELMERVLRGLRNL